MTDIGGMFSYSHNIQGLVFNLSRESLLTYDNNIYVTGCTGMLGELVGSHTKVGDLSHLCNPLWKVVIHALLDTGFQGDVGSDLPG